MAGDLPDPFGDGEHMVVCYSLVQRDAHAGGENGFGLRRLVPRVIHGGEPHFLRMGYWPAKKLWLRKTGLRWSGTGM